LSKFASTPLPHFAENLSSIFEAKKGQSTISFSGLLIYIDYLLLKLLINDFNTFVY